VSRTAPGGPPGTGRRAAGAADPDRVPLSRTSRRRAGPSPLSRRTIPRPAVRRLLADRRPADFSITGHSITRTPAPGVRVSISP